MVSLTEPGDAKSPHARDDRSDNSHRQLIGYIGLLLPWILIIISGLRPAELERWDILGSISAYYYTGAMAAFVGMLVALALFLLTYRGYANRFGWIDRAAAITAGCAALTAAFFPAPAPEGVPTPPWWSDTTGFIHYSSAIVLFAMFAVFSLFLFRLGGSSTNAPEDKRPRNTIHLVCGMTIVASMTWAGIAGFNHRSIFLPESIALTMFAISWLVKGRADRTIAAAVRSAVS